MLFKILKLVQDWNCEITDEMLNEIASRMEEEYQARGISVSENLDITDLSPSFFEFMRVNDYLPTNMEYLLHFPSAECDPPLNVYETPIPSTSKQPNFVSLPSTSKNPSFGVYETPAPSTSQQPNFANLPSTSKNPSFDIYETPAPSTSQQPNFANLPSTSKNPSFDVYESPTASTSRQVTRSHHIVKLSTNHGLSTPSTSCNALNLPMDDLISEVERYINATPNKVAIPNKSTVEASTTCKRKRKSELLIPPKRKQKTVTSTSHCKQRAQLKLKQSKPRVK